MLKPTILIGTLLVSNLAGVCCAMTMPSSEHHQMMMTAVAAGSEVAVHGPTSPCDSREMSRSSFIERNIGRGCVIVESIKGGNRSGHDYAAAIGLIPTLRDLDTRIWKRHCRYHGSSPPEIIEPASGNQLLL